MSEAEGFVVRFERCKELVLAFVSALVLTWFVKTR